MIEPFVETPEQEAALARVLAWWRADCGWGRAEPVMDPNPPQGTQPGIFKVHTEVTPAPNRKRDRPHSNSYGLNSKGRKSHRPEVTAE